MKKPPPKPLFPGKHEFYASLDAFVAASLNLYQAADQVKDLLPPQVRDVMQKRLDEWMALWSAPDDDEKAEAA
jgi:hypothetical protein